MQSVPVLASHLTWTAARRLMCKGIIARMVISVVDARHPLKLLHTRDSKFQPLLACLRSQVRGLMRVGSFSFPSNSGCQAFILGLKFYPFLR